MSQFNNEEYQASLRQIHAKSEEQAHRLRQVADILAFYKQKFQIYLADSVIVWTICTLALHPKRLVCKDRLHAEIDLMYAYSPDAAHRYAQREREQMEVSAKAISAYLLPQVQQAIAESTAHLEKLSRDSIISITARNLIQARNVLDSISSSHLRELIYALYVLCVQIDLRAAGMPTPVEISESLISPNNGLNEVLRSIVSQIASAKPE